jgi:hypothetical protein
MKFIIIGQRTLEPMHLYIGIDKTKSLRFEINGEKDMNFNSSIKPYSSLQLQIALRFLRI